MTDPASTTRITQVGTVFVPVSDQERALAFYRDTLGFEKRADFTYGGGLRWIEVAPPGAANTGSLASGRRVAGRRRQGVVRIRDGGHRERSRGLARERRRG